MIVNPSDRDTTFANTYNPPNAPNPVDVVKDFQRVREYASRHPNHGRMRAGNNLGMNPARIRAWLNETSKPDVVRGLEYARDRDWLRIDSSDKRQPALVTLMAGLFACGGIDRRWVPAWTPETKRAHAHILDALDELGTGNTVRHAESDKPTELLPAEGASVFGRVLIAYGAPQGDKNISSVSHLPDWLAEAPPRSRLKAVEVFILERGSFFDSKDTITIQCQNRPQSYRKDMAELIGSVTDAPVEANANVVVSASAARDLGFGRADPLRA